MSGETFSQKGQRPQAAGEIVDLCGRETLVTVDADHMHDGVALLFAWWLQSSISADDRSGPDLLPLGPQAVTRNGVGHVSVEVVRDEAKASDSSRHDVSAA